METGLPLYSSFAYLLPFSFLMHRNYLKTEYFQLWQFEARNLDESRLKIELNVERQNLQIPVKRERRKGHKMSGKGLWQRS